MKKRSLKISKRTITLSILFLLLTATVSAYFIIKNSQGEVQSWMDSNWMYRKSISVGNDSGSTLTNEEVLIEMDTATLIATGKMQTDCDDLRLAETDGTSLSYWVEGGCNSATTQVWVQIPSIPTEGTSIYVYYGNGSAVNSEETWAGDFLVLNSSSCASGWIQETSYEGYFPYGSATYGTTNSGSHSHSQVSCTSGYASGSSWNSSDDESPNRSAFKTAHTHTNLKVDVDDAVIDPGHVGLFFCSNTDLTYEANSIAIFNTDSTSLPTDFTYYTALESKYPKGSATYVASGGSATHTHTTSGGYNTGTANVTDSQDAGGPSTANFNHYHTSVDGTTDAGDNNIPYYEVVYGQNSTNTVASSGILQMSTAVPPLGWTRFSDLDGKYPKGASTAGGSYAGATHTHSVTITTGYASSSKDGVYTKTGTTFISNLHTHSCTTTSSSTQALAPYISTIFIERNTSQSTTLDIEEVYNTNPDQPSSLETEGLTNPSNVVDHTPEFTAIFSDTDTEDTGNSYQIEVNTTSSFDGTTMWNSTKTSFGTPIVNGARTSEISYAGTDLEPGTTYYWRIKLWDNNDGESEWSTTANFTMNQKPNTPTNLQTESETDPIKVEDMTPEFTTAYSDPEGNNGQYYQIEVNTTSSFDGTTMWDSTKTEFTIQVTSGTTTEEMSYAGTTLTADGNTYYWRIKIWDVHDNASDWSTYGTFIMQGGPYAPTELQVNSEVNPLELTDLTPAFSALYTDPNEDSGTAYEIEVNSNDTFTGTVMWDSGKVSTTVTNNTRSDEFQYDGTPLSNSENTYYCRMRFWDTDDMVGEWSETFSFVDYYPAMYFEGLGLEGININ